MTDGNVLSTEKEKQEQQKLLTENDLIPKKICALEVVKHLKDITSALAIAIPISFISLFSLALDNSVISAYATIFQLGLLFYVFFKYRKELIRLNEKYFKKG